MEKCNCSKVKVRTEEDKKKLTIRLNKIIGQMNGIKKMIEEDRYCDDVLTQLSAVDKSIKSLAYLILDDHMHSCLIDGILRGDTDMVDEIMELIKRFQ